MADTAVRTVLRTRGRAVVGVPPAGAGSTTGAGEQTGRRHPLVAAAMVLPLAAVLAVVFGGWEAVVTQASSVAGMLGR
ncbi:hypothetical protein IHE55_25255 [Streptomyces pactum]|uniref:Uncharacterized protein n=1 Tax=Streptomyces pactum TaxID=68249 RepID=A0ABS0NRU3_9ACTN|nr:hypothetical protein [Streptomyces pactum]MBH5337911.1 hypothetical protein [Streptomyces pactum]